MLYLADMPDGFDRQEVSAPRREMRASRKLTNDMQLHVASCKESRLNPAAKIVPATLADPARPPH